MSQPWNAEKDPWQSRRSSRSSLRYQRGVDPWQSYSSSFLQEASRQAHCGRGCSDRPQPRLTAKLSSGLVLHFFNDEDTSNFLAQIKEAVVDQIRSGPAGLDATVPNCAGSGWRSRAMLKQLNKALSPEEVIDAEVGARLRAQEPAIRAQVSAMVLHDENHHSASRLIDPDDQVLATAGRHLFRRPFIGLSPKDARMAQRGHRKERLEKTCVVEVPEGNVIADTGVVAASQVSAEPRSAAVELGSGGVQTCTETLNSGCAACIAREVQSLGKPDTGHRDGAPAVLTPEDPFVLNVAPSVVTDAHVSEQPDADSVAVLQASVCHADHEIIAPLTAQTGQAQQQDMGDFDSSALHVSGHPSFGQYGFSPVRGDWRSLPKDFWDRAHSKLVPARGFSFSDLELQQLRHLLDASNEAFLAQFAESFSGPARAETSCPR